MKIRRHAPKIRPLSGVIDVYKCMVCGRTLAVSADAQTFREPPPLECHDCPGQPDMLPGRYYKVGTASSAERREPSSVTPIPPSPWRVRCAACGTVHAGHCPAQPTVAVLRAWHWIARRRKEASDG